MRKNFSFFFQFWKAFFIEVLLFSLALGLGIFTAFRINEIFQIQNFIKPQISFWDLIFNFLFATLFILFIIRFLKFQKGKRIIFKIIFSLTAFLGGGVVLNIWLPDIWVFLSLIFLIFWWWKKPFVFNQDLLIILGIAGAGSILGLSLQSWMVIILLIIFSIYDFLAVYKTKHMIKMAKEMMESRAIPAIIIPPNIFGFKESLDKIQPGGEFLILGGGDIIFPLLLSSSLVPVGWFPPFLVAIFSLLGLWLSFYLFTRQKVRQPIPALPPIALFSIFGYFLIKFLT